MGKIEERSYLTVLLFLLTFVLFSLIVGISKLVDTSFPHNTYGVDDWKLLHIFEILGLSALLLSIFHSLRIYGKRYTIIFFPSCFLYGLMLEIPFDSYNQNAWLKIGPYGSMLAVVAGWCTLIYTLSTLSKKLRDASILDRGIACGLLGVCIDLSLDPIASSYGLWYWDETFFGFHVTKIFGVPAINFMNWFYTIAIFVIFQEVLAESRFSFPKKLLISILAVPLLVFVVFLLAYAFLNLL